MLKKPVVLYSVSLGSCTEANYVLNENLDLGNLFERILLFFPFVINSVDKKLEFWKL